MLPKSLSEHSFECGWCTKESLRLDLYQDPQAHPVYNLTRLATFWFPPGLLERQRALLSLPPSLWSITKIFLDYPPLCLRYDAQGSSPYSSKGLFLISTLLDWGYYSNLKVSIRTHQSIYESRNQWKGKTCFCFSPNQEPFYESTHFWRSGSHWCLLYIRGFLSPSQSFLAVLPFPCVYFSKETLYLLPQQIESPPSCLYKGTICSKRIFLFEHSIRIWVSTHLLVGRMLLAILSSLYSLQLWFLCLVYREW